MSASSSPACLATALVALLVTAPAGGAQVVGGRVLDRTSRLPARNVGVSLLGDADSVIARTTTDSTGLFYVVLKAPARVRLQFGIGGMLAFMTDTMALATDDYVQNDYLIELPRVYTKFMVEKQVSQVPGTGHMTYPPDLKAAGLDGEVLAQFVVDTTGRAVPDSFHVLYATDVGFVQAVRSALWTIRFYPAEVDGHKVRQLVQQPFTFTISR